MSGEAKEKKLDLCVQGSRKATSFGKGRKREVGQMLKIYSG